MLIRLWTKRYLLDCGKIIKFISEYSYKNTPRKRYFEAQDYIVNWHPDANTSIMIKKLNVQKEVGALA